VSEPRLVLRPDLHFEPGGEATVLLLDERRVHVLEDPLYARLMPLLDGVRSADDIVDALREESPALVYYALSQLQERGLVVEAADLPLGVAAFWSALGIDPASAVRRLEQSGAAVRAAGAEAGPLEAALRGLGVAGGDDLVVWVVDDYMRPELEAFNRERRTPWMVMKPVGMELWLGPIFDLRSGSGRERSAPRPSGCWQCLAHALAFHRQVQRLLRPDGGFIPTSRAALPSTAAAAAHMAATEAARFLVDGSSRLLGRVVTLDVATLETREHLLRRRATCPVCGNDRAPVQGARPVTLMPCPIAFAEDGGFRTAPPERTLERLAPLVSPITGIVPVLQRRASDPEGLVAACVSGFNQAFPADDFGRLRRTMRLITAGKGKSDAQARASALAEAVERYCGAFHGDEPRRRARLADLDAAFHPRDLMLFSERQYAERARRSFNAVPPPFDEEQEIEWTPAWSLGRNEECWLPAAFCWVGYDLQGTVCVADSNGNAAGNTLEEAILQGLLELCERDAVALWWYNKVPRPALDLESLGEPYVLRLRDSYRRLGREIWVLDITNDLGVPSYAAVSRRTEGPHEEIVLGFGAHLDPRLAVLRAMTEINQFVSGTPSAPVPPRGVDADVDAWLDATVAAESYLAPRGTVSAASRAWSLDLRENVEALRGVLASAGMDVLVLDQSRPEVDLAVVKVVVPGLRHFWERFAPGRLYDVPVRLGWLPRPNPEEALNPLRMFL
jgi:ribosomal protein S12 methylthiotransferase accessory factor